MILSSFKDGVMISVLTAAGVPVAFDDVAAFELAVAIEIEVAVAVEVEVGLEVEVISDTAFGVTKVRNELDSRSTDGLGWMRTYNDDL